jgi:hypothetical protein
MMPSRLEAADFFTPGDFHVGVVDSAMRYLESDPAWVPLVTAELRHASLKSRFCLLKLYEAATGKRLLDERFDPHAFGREMDRSKAAQRLLAERSSGAK